MSEEGSQEEVVEETDSGSSDSGRRYIAEAPFDLSYLSSPYLDISNDPRYRELTENERLRTLEEEQELLNHSLIALTSHFAQVQFRLRQIVEAPPDSKEALLKDLEEFAFSGIPVPQSETHVVSTLPVSTLEPAQREANINLQRVKQKELITQLKSQLEQLEQYAYESGQAGLPQSIVIERQKVIIDELKSKLHLNIDHIDQLTLDDLKDHLDFAIAQLISPMKMKEQLVTQLKTQITDLERFIAFIQGHSGSGASGSSQTKCTCKCPVHRYSQTLALTDSSTRQRTEHELQHRTLNIVKRVVDVLHVFAGQERDKYKRNVLKKTMKHNHWGDVAAELELAIVLVISLAQNNEPTTDSDYMSDSEGLPYIQCNGKLARAVRKEFAPRLQALLEHGCIPQNHSVSIVQPFLACLPHGNTSPKQMHAWELIVRYYEMKQGHQFNATPARKLSQSFNLDLVGGQISTKQRMLQTIGNILTTHAQFKRSNDSHFKAFVCEAMNAKLLAQWLRILMKSQRLVAECYQPWSYAVMTGFEDTLRSIEKLSACHFNMPADSSIRPFQNIRHAF